MKVLIVEKERDFLYSLERLLKKRGYEISTAFDGVQGTEEMLSDNFDAIVFGEQIPRISAEEIIAKAKENGKTSAFVLMRKNKNELAETRNDNGCFDVVVNLPFTPADLYGHIEDVVNLKNVK
ncbi:MAG: response regulator transcription factor [Clostridia bacterium]|nr:response regulator transcription factor [Clostridia bacterium]